MNYEPLSFIKNPIKCLGPPTIVEIDFNVRSMGPISEVDMVSDLIKRLQLMYQSQYI